MNGAIAVDAVRTDPQLPAAMPAQVDDPLRSGQIVNLARFVRTAFDEAKRAKDLNLTERLLDCARRRRGEYHPRKLAELKAAGGSEIWLNLTEMKCLATEAWVKDLYNPFADKIVSLEPTPVPEINPELAQQVTMVVQMEMRAIEEQGAMIHPMAALTRANELYDSMLMQTREMAKQRTARGEQKILDQMVEGKFRDAFDDFLTDFTTFPTAFMKGPILRRRRKLQWVNGRPVVAWKDVWEFTAPSFFDLFFDPSLVSLRDGYVIERHHLTMVDLQSVRGVEGYSDVAIDQVLRDFGRTGLREWLYADQERARLEDKRLQFVMPTSTIEALEYSGPMTGEHLAEFGFKDYGLEPNELYDANVWVIGPYVIRAMLNNDPLLRRDYHAASFSKLPGTIVGRALPEKMADVQDMANGAARALHVNMSYSSGPIVDVQIDRLPEGEALTRMVPWKVIQTLSKGVTQPAVAFYQPQSNAQELTGTIEFFVKKADEVTGIPNYTYGSTDVSGAGRTMGGLSMLMGAASKGIKSSVFNIDTGVIEPVAERLSFENMTREPDMAAIGDVQVKARGAMSLMIKEMMAQRRNEFLASTNNPIDFGIMGPVRRAELLRETAKSLDLEADRVVPTREEIVQQVQMQQQAAAAQPPGEQPGQPQEGR
jgi:hypothetical protein